MEKETASLSPTRLSEGSHIRPKKSFWFLIIGRLQNRRSDTLFFLVIFFLPTGNYVIHVYAGNKFPTYKVWVAKRSLTNRTKVHTPCEKVV